MNQLEKHITDILHLVAKGSLKVEANTAARIIILVNKYNTPAPAAKAKLYRYNAATKGWDAIRVVLTTNEIIDTRTSQALTKAPVMDFYKFELTNSRGESEGIIYTADMNLF